MIRASVILLAVVPLIHGVRTGKSPVVELRLMQSKNSDWDNALEQATTRREQEEADFIKRLEQTFNDELLKAKPLLEKTVSNIVSQHKSFLETRPESLLIKVVDQKPISADIKSLITENEKAMNIQEAALLRSCFEQVHRVVNQASKNFLQSVDSKVPFDIQLESPKTPYVKLENAVEKLAFLRSEALKNINARIQSMVQKVFKQRRSTAFIQQPHVSVGSPADGDASALLNEILSEASGIVSVGSKSSAAPSKDLLDKASDDMRSITDGALAFQNVGASLLSRKPTQFLQAGPVPNGKSIGNRLYDTEPMPSPTVASLNIFVEEDNGAANNLAKFSALRSQISQMDSELKQALNQ